MAANSNNVYYNARDNSFNNSFNNFVSSNNASNGGEIVHKIRKGKKLYRGGAVFSAGTVPSDIAFFALTRSTAAVYAGVHALRGGIVPKVGAFEPMRTLRLFVMTPSNLLALAAANLEDGKLLHAIRNVTGVGLETGNAYYRVDAPSMTPMLKAKIAQCVGRACQAAVMRQFSHGLGLDLPTALSMLATIAPVVPEVVLAKMYPANSAKSSNKRLQVNTSGFLTAENKKANIYASKRLALEMKRVLEPMGFDGWVYRSGAIRATKNARRSVPAMVRLVAQSQTLTSTLANMAEMTTSSFHEEVMVWDAPHKLENLGVLGVFR